jgi:hypothetical protein
MGGKPHEHMTQEIGPTQLFQLGKRQTDAVLNLQKELLDTYEEASRAWLSRVKSEVELWSNLASKLTHPFRSRGPGNLSGLRLAARANGRRRWTTPV